MGVQIRRPLRLGRVFSDLLRPSLLHDLVEIANKIEGQPYEHQLEKKHYKGVAFQPYS
jgi:hypothetical protein